MQQATNETPLVHVVDDDASMRGALEGLFDSVGLQTQTYATAKHGHSAKHLTPNISSSRNPLWVVRTPDTYSC